MTDTTVMTMCSLNHVIILSESGGSGRRDWLIALLNSMAVWYLFV